MSRYGFNWKFEKKQGVSAEQAQEKLVRYRFDQTLADRVLDEIAEEET